MATRASTGCFVVDQRDEPPSDVASDWASAPSPTEVADLVAATMKASQRADVLVVCNPMPGEALPWEAYASLVESSAARGTRVVVDLSTPRLDAALHGGPALVKLNDWELAELVSAPVGQPAERRAALLRLVDMGAESVIVTRGSSTVHAVDPARGAVDSGRGAGDGCGCGALRRTRRGIA